MQLSSEEEKFIEWWEQNRNIRKKSYKQLMIGLPMATVFVVAIMFNFFSGWYKRASMIINTQSFSLIIVLLIASIAIIVFYSIFSSRYKWEENEQRYMELQAKKNSTKSSG